MPKIHKSIHTPTHSFMKICYSKNVAGEWCQILHNDGEREAMTTANTLVFEVGGLQFECWCHLCVTPCVPVTIPNTPSIFSTWLLLEVCGYCWARQTTDKYPTTFTQNFPCVANAFQISRQRYIFMDKEAWILKTCVKVTFHRRRSIHTLLISVHFANITIILQCIVFYIHTHFKANGFCQFILKWSCTVFTLSWTAAMHYTTAV